MAATHGGDKLLDQLPNFGIFKSFTHINIGHRFSHRAIETLKAF